jgi:hypothetical protein
MSLKVHISAANSLRAFALAPERIDAELRQLLTFAAVDFEGAVVARTPVGATGHLRGSITHDITGAGVTMVGRVFSQDEPVKVASVEHGARPHWAPIGPLILWSTRKLGDPKAAYAIQKAIAVRGTRAHGMFNRGYQDALPKVRARIVAFNRSLDGIV